MSFIYVELGLGDGVWSIQLDWASVLRRHGVERWSDGPAGDVRRRFAHPALIAKGH